MSDKGLERTLVREFDFDRDTLMVTRAPDVPGLIVFSAGERNGGRRRVTGVYDGHRIERDFEKNLTAVLGALGYDGSDGVAPATVAATIGLLEGDPGAPFLTEDALRLGGADMRVMHPPRAASVDGEPAVEYWNASSRSGPWRSRVVAHRDGTYEVIRTTLGQVQQEG